MQFGLSGAGMSVADAAEVVVEAERLGYDSVWAGEAYGTDSATLLAWLAAHTDRMRLGAGIFQIPARSAAMTAMTASTIDQLSGGRMVLGLGASGPLVAEGLHGQRFSSQLQRTREYVAVVRQALAGERVQIDGQTLVLPLPGNPGRPLKLSSGPLQERLPIYLAAIGPRSMRLVGEVADGWLAVLLSPEHVSGFRQQLSDGASRGERSLTEFEIVASVPTRIDDDLAAARDAMRPLLATYLGGMGSRGDNVYNRLVCGYGFDAGAAVVQDLFLSGKRQEAMAAVPDELIDLLTLCGPRERVRDRLAVYRDAGIGTLSLSLVGAGKDHRIAQLRQVAQLAAAPSLAGVELDMAAV
jgi:F420-dependent oxidoreductase-like protein